MKIRPIGEESPNQVTENVKIKIQGSGPVMPDHRFIEVIDSF